MFSVLSYKLCHHYTQLGITCLLIMATCVIDSCRYVVSTGSMIKIHFTGWHPQVYKYEKLICRYKKKTFSFIISVLDFVFFSSSNNRTPSIRKNQEHFGFWYDYGWYKGAMHNDSMFSVYKENEKDYWYLAIRGYDTIYWYYPGKISMEFLQCWGSTDQALATNSSESSSCLHPNVSSSDRDQFLPLQLRL